MGALLLVGVLKTLNVAGVLSSYVICTETRIQECGNGPEGYCHCYFRQPQEHDYASVMQAQYQGMSPNNGSCNFKIACCGPTCASASMEATFSSMRSNAEKDEAAQQ